jgi:hypothetical protein
LLTVNEAAKSANGHRLSISCTTAKDSIDLNGGLRKDLLIDAEPFGRALLLHANPFAQRVVFARCGDEEFGG